MFIFSSWLNLGCMEFAIYMPYISILLAILGGIQFAFFRDIIRFPSSNFGLQAWQNDFYHEYRDADTIATDLDDLIMHVCMRKYVLLLLTWTSCR